MFNKILIANRGEIACRIIRTAKRMGIRTVAVYSEADAAARHVTLADEAIEIGPAPANQSYLVSARIMEAAGLTGAEAIHPGYGFLAENAEFAAACEQRGVIFIGPPVTAIRAMGSKSAAKTIMEKTGVPMLPGYHGTDQEPALLSAEAERVGFPVMIKAAAGGGGKGMRVVDTAADFDTALVAAKREATAAFSDDTVLIEKYLVRPRHIELQIFRDNHGHAIHLFERDCSIQRRHQKVLEEAPAPALDETRRTLMGKTALAAAKAIDYAGAGTVEFIVDSAGEYYFMEMNTRLQVEHPVTELITGLDMVEWQVRIAAGEPLPLEQKDLAINGHAMEARIYAEDPDRGFLPATGHLTHLRFPADSHHVRVDTGVRQGDTISVHYDPMIAKLIVWDRDRKSCLRRMRRALNETQVVGLATNIDFLASVVGHSEFHAGNIDTGFIERHHAGLFVEDSQADAAVLAVATLFVLLQRERRLNLLAQQTTDPWSPWNLARGWRLNEPAGDILYLEENGREHEIRISYLQTGYAVVIDGTNHELGGELHEDGDLLFRLDGKQRRVTVIREDDDRLAVLWAGRSHELRVMDKTRCDVDTDAMPGALISPMPGKVIAVLVRENDTVTRGAPLLIVEAMKMEHTIAAPIDGKITRIHYSTGDMIDEGVELLVLEENQCSTG